jgi:hypothetical protein
MDTRPSWMVQRRLWPSSNTNNSVISACCVPSVHRKTVDGYGITCEGVYFGQWVSRVFSGGVNGSIITKVNWDCTGKSDRNWLEVSARPLWTMQLLVSSLVKVLWSYYGDGTLTQRFVYFQRLMKTGDIADCICWAQYFEAETGWSIPVRWETSAECWGIPGMEID